MKIDIGKLVRHSARVNAAKPGAVKVIRDKREKLMKRAERSDRRAS